MKKIKFLYSCQIDPIKWDACVQNSVNKKIYACSWYLDIISKNWAGLIYGDYELVFPIIFKKWWFLKKIYHPFFCQQLGPYAVDKKLLHNKALLLSIIDFLNTKYRTFEFSINHVCSKSIIQVISKTHGIQSVERVNLELSLDNSYEKLRSNYSTNHRRNLTKKINNFYWDISNSGYIGQDYIIEFLKFYKTNIGCQAYLKKNDYEIIHMIMSKCSQQRIGYLVGLRNDQDQLLGCAFFVSCFNRSILLFNASDKGLNFNLMIFIIDKYIQKNTQKNHILDFEGSNIQGVKRFYKGFGSIEKNYIHIFK